MSNSKCPQCIKRETCQVDYDDCYYAQQAQRMNVALSLSLSPLRPMTAEERVKSAEYQKHRELVDAQNRIADAHNAKAEATSAIANQMYFARITNWGRA